MAAMMPKINCAQCGSALARKDATCPSCGVEIDWMEDVAAPKERESILSRLKKRRQNKEILQVWSPKTVLGVLVIILILVVVYEVVITNRPADELNQQSKQLMSGDSQMSPQLQELIKRVAENPDDLVSTLELANILHDSQLYEKAIKYYQKYLGHNPENADARVDLGICYKELGNISEAKKEMKTALQYAPKHLYAHFNLGIVSLTEGNLKESNEWLKKTVDLDPGSEVGKRAQQLLIQHKSQ